MKLEKQYRLLACAFPRRWRERRGEELVSTLIDGSEPGQRFVDVGDAVDVVRQGLIARFSDGGPVFLVLIAASLLSASTIAVHIFVTPTSMSFLAASLVVVLAPGTGVICTMSTAIGRGWQQGALAALGCTFGILPHLFAASVGLSGLMQSSAVAFEAVRWVGVVYLGYLAISMLRSKGRLSDTPAVSGSVEPVWWTVRRGVLLNLLNPKLTIFFFAFLPQFIDSPPALLDPRVAGLSMVFMAMTLVVFLLYAAFAAQLRERVLSTPRIVRRIEQSLGVLLLGFAAQLASADR